MLRIAAAAVAATPLAGCDVFDGTPQAAPSDPLAPLARSAEDLAARYDAAILGQPALAQRLRPVADAHREHAVELARVAGLTPPPSGAGTPTASGPAAATGDTKAVLATLRRAERQGQEAARAACLAAPADRAALLGSIAAARASHLEVLR